MSLYFSSLYKSYAFISGRSPQVQDHSLRISPCVVHFYQRCSFHNFFLIPLILCTVTQGILHCEQDWKAWGHVTPLSFFIFSFFAIIKLLPTLREISHILFILFLAWMTPQELLHITCTCDINQLLKEKPMRKCILN